MAVRICNGVYSLPLSFFQHYKTIVLNLFLIRSETFMTEMKREKKKSDPRLLKLIEVNKSFNYYLRHVLKDLRSLSLESP